MMCLFADLPLCRGLPPHASRYASPDQSTARPDLPFVRARNSSSRESYCASAVYDNGSNPMAAACRDVAKFSFNRVVLCLEFAAPNR
jgi:hypothetical protein